MEEVPTNISWGFMGLLNTFSSHTSAVTFTMSQTRKVLQYVYNENNDEQISKLMLMSIRHLGFNNMLHDYLNKCGVSQHQT